MKTPSPRARRVPPMGWRILLCALSVATLAAAPPPGADPRIIAELGVLGRDHDPAFSPDSTWLLTIGNEEFIGKKSYFVTKWDIRTRKVLATFPVKTRVADYFSRLTISPSGKAFAYSDFDGKIFVCDSTTGKAIFSYKPREGHSIWPELLLFLDEDHIFSVDGDGIGQKRNIRDKRIELHRLSSPFELKGIASSPRKRLLAYFSTTSLLITKIDLKKEDHQSLSHELNSFNDRLLAVTDDGAYVLASLRSTGLALYDVKAEKLLRRWPGHETYEDFDNGVAKIVAISGRSVFVTSDYYGNIRFWNERGERLAEIRHYSGGVESLVVSPDGKMMAAGGGDQPIVLWDLEKILPKKAK